MKDYLTFSQKERNGLITLFLLSAAIFLFFRYFSVKKVAVSKVAFQQELAQLKITVDSSNAKSYQREENYVDYLRPKHYGYDDNTKKELFEFDPNTLDANGWKRLGVREKTINTIQNFLARGFTFRRPEDIKKVYGLNAKDAEKFIPYIHIAQKESYTNNSFANDSRPVYTPNAPAAARKTRIIDVNTADTSALILLPGIGSKLASRIVNFRQKLGGFSTVAQLGETYGVPDSTFQKIKVYMKCDNPTLKTININTADINLLRTHPYLRWNIANAIINYRQQHGNYKMVEDLRKIDIITDDLYNKIAPYLVI